MRVVVKEGGGTVRGIGGGSGSGCDGGIIWLCVGGGSGGGI